MCATRSPRWCGSSTPRSRAADKSAHSVALLGNNVYFDTGNDSPNPAPDRARQEFRRGRVRRRHHRSGSRAQPGTLVGAARGQGQDPGRASANKGENGRGYVAAYTADTGKLLWRFLVVPDPGKPGSETWADPRTIPTGGGGDLDRAVLRSGDQPRLCRHRQPGAHVRPAGPAGRQSLHQLDHRARRRYRQVEVVLPDRAQRVLGL